MKLTIALFALIGCAMAADPWTEFKRLYGKTYSGPGEEELRKSIFEANLRMIADHNAQHDLGLTSFRMGVNQLSDLSQEEKRKMPGFLGGLESFVNGKDFAEVAEEGLPATVDWRKAGIVAPVKNQGTCGSCWAFSAVSALESAHAQATGKLVELSEQNVVDCAWPEGSSGCSGGYPWHADQLVINEGGIDSEKSYPYLDKDAQCAFNKKNVSATITGYVNITSGDEKALQKAVATVGPISVCVDAGFDSFWSYKSGVYYQPDCPNGFYDLTHCVVVEGYGTEDGKDYWLVRNSYGVSYGEEGYIKMSRNRDNNCGIATLPTYPIV